MTRPSPSLHKATHLFTSALSAHVLKCVPSTQPALAGQRTMETGSKQIGLGGLQALPTHPCLAGSDTEQACRLASCGLLATQTVSPQPPPPAPRPQEEGQIREDATMMDTLEEVPGLTPEHTGCSRLCKAHFGAIPSNPCPRSPRPALPSCSLSHGHCCQSPELRAQAEPLSTLSPTAGLGGYWSA